MQTVAGAATVARDGFVSDFDALSRQVAGAQPAWIQRTRKAAIARFRELAFPTLKHEEWKYTNLAPIATTRFALAGAEGPDQATWDQIEPFAFRDLRGPRLVFVNGRHASGLSNPGSLPDGVRLGSLADVLETDPEAAEPHLARYAKFQDHPFVALNTAFLHDGAYVEIPAGQAVASPIHLLFASTASGAPAVSHPRNLIVLGQGSQATVIESYFEIGSDVSFTNAVTEVNAGEGAVLDHYKVQRESERAFHVATLQVQQERASSVADNSISFGGALVRNDINAVFHAEGGAVALNGLYAVRGRQHVDFHTKIDHVEPQCTSTELYKGILDDRSRAVFNGQIYVRPDAQKTNAGQHNKNLLLSKDALVHSTPGLEINANDVKCVHGSSIGQLEEDAIFYLRSRGIEEETVRSLLTYAFAVDVIRKIQVEPVRAALDDLLLERLPNGDAVREAL